MMHKSITFITAKVFLWKAKKKKKCKHKPSKFRDIFQFFFGVSLFWLFSFQLIFFHSINAELILARCTHFNWNGEKKSTGLFLGHTESPPTTNHHYQNDACKNACNSGEKTQSIEILHSRKIRLENFLFLFIPNCVINPLNQIGENENKSQITKERKIKEKKKRTRENQREKNVNI